MPTGRSHATQMKQQREAAGHTIGTLAKKANVSDLTIQTLENGGATTTVEMQLIANALGVSLSTLGQIER